MESFLVLLLNPSAILDGIETEDFTWLNASEITMDVAPAADTLITIKRLTNQEERIVDFQDGGVIREATLDLDSNQLFYLAHDYSPCAVLSASAALSTSLS